MDTHNISNSTKRVVARRAFSVGTLGLGLIVGLAIQAHPPTPDEASLAVLGAKLFSDKSLSSDGSVSCSSCHRQEFAFSDGKRNSVGALNQTGTRNAPSLLDVSMRATLFWDGRRANIENLILDPIMTQREHNLSGELDLLYRVSRSKLLMNAYSTAFGDGNPPTSRKVVGLYSVPV